MTAARTARRSFIVTLGLVTAAAALTVDLSLPAVPGMVRALATELPRGQLIVGVFMAGMAFGQIPAGLFSDRLGRLPVLFTGLTLFSIAATVAAGAGDITTMLAARFVQGFGAASAIVLSRAIVRDIASGREAARLMSLMTMIFTVAPVVAPSIGALLVAAWGWRAPFVFIALGGFALLFAVRLFLVETHRPLPSGNPLQQLRDSVRMFFSYRRSVFALLLLVLPPAGYMSIIAVSAALTVEIYGFSLQEYGLVFALAGISILAGAACNRVLVARFEPLQLIGIAIGLIGLASLQLAVMAIVDGAAFWWLWGSVCLYMFTIAILMPNATVVALHPLPTVAGVASSIIGTLQNVVGAAGAVLGALLYDGSVRNTVVIICSAGLLVVAVFLARRLIVPRWSGNP